MMFPSRSIKQVAWIIVTAVTALMAVNVNAGPPYVTDDPAPTDYQHWEIFHFVSFTHVPNETAGAAGLDLNYGAAENLQLTLVLPAEFEHASDTHWRGGDVELAAKYRLAVSPSDHTPDVAFFPRIFIPTHHAEPTHISLLLPLWIGKEHESWNWFGGGGYLINPGDGNRNAWLSGIAVTKTISEKVRLGAEIYHQTPQADGDEAFTAINLGAEYRLNKHWLLIASFGSGIQHAREEGQYSGYLAFKAEY